MTELTPTSRILRFVYYVLFIIMWGSVESVYPNFVKFINAFTFCIVLFLLAGAIERWRVSPNEDSSGSGKA